MLEACDSHAKHTHISEIDLIFNRGGFLAP